MSKIIDDLPGDLFHLVLDFFTWRDYPSQLLLLSKKTNEQILGNLVFFAIEGKFKSSGAEYEGKLKLIQSHFKGEKGIESKHSSKKQNFISMIKNNVVSIRLLFYMELPLIKSVLDNIGKLTPGRGKVTLKLNTESFFNTQDKHIKSAIVQYSELLCDEKLQFSLDDVIQMEEQHQTGALLLEAYSKYPDFRAGLSFQDKQKLLLIEHSALQKMVEEYQWQSNPPVFT